MEYRDAPSRVSVVIPAYDAEAFLADCLSSVLAQSHCPAEVIVVDDGSKDGTVNVARSFGDRVTCLCQQNAGPAAVSETGEPWRRAMNGSPSSTQMTCGSPGAWSVN